MYLTKQLRANLELPFILWYKGTNNERRNVKYALITFLLAAIVPLASQANFSGMVYNESPTAAVESMIEYIFSNSNIYEKLNTKPHDLKNLKEALLKGCSNDRDIFLGLMRIQNKILPEVKNLSLDEREKIYDNNLAYIKTAALEFGYREQDN